MNLTIFSAFPELESSRLLFRDLGRADSHEIFEMRSDPQIYQFLDRPPAQSVEDIVKFKDIIKLSFEDHTGISWVIMEKTTLKIAGYIGLWRIVKEHNRGEIGYALKPKYWGQGIMKEAIDTVVRFGFDKLELHSIMADVNPVNSKSLRVLEKCNFKREAYLRENFFYSGKYLDSVIFGLLKKDIE